MEQIIHSSNKNKAKTQTAIKLTKTQQTNTIKQNKQQTNNKQRGNTKQ